MVAAQASNPFSRSLKLVLFSTTLVNAGRPSVHGTRHRYIALATGTRPPHVAEIMGLDLLHSIYSILQVPLPSLPVRKGPSGSLNSLSQIITRSRNTETTEIWRKTPWEPPKLHYASPERGRGGYM